jgi:hypothetical protein
MIHPSEEYLNLQTQQLLANMLVRAISSQSYIRTEQLGQSLAKENIIGVSMV